MTRRYRSPLRDEKANRTRTALLDACEALLLELPVEAVTLPAVAERAGVTKPTAYRHFADNDALVAGFLDHLRGRIGMDLRSLAAVAPDALPAAVRANYGKYDRNAQLLTRVMDSPSYERARRARKVDRAGLALPTWGGASADRALRERLGALYLFVTPAAWRWLRETWGLSGPGAARAASWAMESLVHAAKKEKKP